MEWTTSLSPFVLPSVRRRARSGRVLGQFVLTLGDLDHFLDSGYGTFISEEPSRWDQRGRLLAAQRACQMCTLNQVVVSPLPPLTSSYPAWTDVSHHEGDTRPRRSRNRMNGMSDSCRTPCTTRGNRNCV